MRTRLPIALYLITDLLGTLAVNLFLFQQEALGNQSWLPTLLGFIVCHYGQLCTKCLPQIKTQRIHRCFVTILLGTTALFLLHIFPAGTTSYADQLIFAGKYFLLQFGAILLQGAFGSIWPSGRLFKSNWFPYFYLLVIQLLQ